MGLWSIFSSQRKHFWSVPEKYIEKNDKEEHCKFYLRHFPLFLICSPPADPESGPRTTVRTCDITLAAVSSRGWVWIFMTSVFPWPIGSSCPIINQHTYKLTQPKHTFFFFLNAHLHRCWNFICYTFNTYCINKMLFIFSVILYTSFTQILTSHFV